MILQRAQRHETINSAGIKNKSGIFGPTVCVDVKLNGMLHKALLDTRSNMNIISEQTYKLYAPPMLLSDFHHTVLSAINNPFRIKGKIHWNFGICSGYGRWNGLLRQPGQRLSLDFRETNIVFKRNVFRNSVKATQDGHRKQTSEFDNSLENNKNSEKSELVVQKMSNHYTDLENQKKP